MKKLLMEVEVGESIAFLSVRIKLKAPGKTGKEISKVVHKRASFRIELMNEQPCSWEDNVFATSSFSPLSSSALHLLPTHLCGAALLIGKWLGGL